MDDGTDIAQRLKALHDQIADQRAERMTVARRILDGKGTVDDLKAIELSRGIEQGILFALTTLGFVVELPSAPPPQASPPPSVLPQ